MNDKILLIEDEKGIAETISYALGTENFDTVLAFTGSEGLLALKEHPVRLIVLDIGLPDINGFELVKTIRRESDIPILILTSRADEIDRILGLELGADDYMVKPFSPRELMARIKAILRRSGTGREDGNASVPLFGIDENRHRISYCGQILPLSRYEYQIMSLLIKRPGWVFSRQQIMDLIWEEPDDSFERTVDTHIKSIRAKLRAVNPDSDPIETHRGTGYALRENP